MRGAQHMLCALCRIPACGGNVSWYCLGPCTLVSTIASYRVSWEMRVWYFALCLRRKLSFADARVILCACRGKIEPHPVAVHDILKLSLYFHIRRWGVPISNFWRQFGGNPVGWSEVRKAKLATCWKSHLSFGFHNHIPTPVLHHWQLLSTILGGNSRLRYDSWYLLPTWKSA